MTSDELRSRARRYGYTGQTKEKMLEDLCADSNNVNTVLVLTGEWERARAKAGLKGD